MHKRPILKIELSVMDTIIEYLGWLFLLLTWVLTIYFFSTLPNILVTHFNAGGKADGIGDKSQIFSLPIVGSVIFMGITFLNKFPHIFNFLVEITPENAQKQYQSATRLLRMLKLIIVVIFITITLLTIKVSINKNLQINPWIIPLYILILFSIIAFFIFKSIKKKNLT